MLVTGAAYLIEESNAKKTYVCNVATQKGETDEYTVTDHVEALQKHTFPNVVDRVVASNTPVELELRFKGVGPVVVDGRSPEHVRAIIDDLVDQDHPVRGCQYPIVNPIYSPVMLRARLGTG